MFFNVFPVKFSSQGASMISTSLRSYKSIEEVTNRQEDVGVWEKLRTSRPHLFNPNLLKLHDVKFLAALQQTDSIVELTQQVT